MEAKFLDLLFCEGCINGTGFPQRALCLCPKGTGRHVCQSSQGRSEEDRTRRICGNISRVTCAASFTPGRPQVDDPEPEYHPGDPAADEKDPSGGRTKLRRLRLQFLPGKGQRRLLGAGGKRNVPALPIDQLEENLNRLAQSHSDFGKPSSS